jgi:hypothetical protein
MTRSAAAAFGIIERVHGDSVGKKSTLGDEGQG